MLRMFTLVLGLAFSSLAVAASVTASVAASVAGLGDGLGTADHSTMAMKFEVTFMKIDVANVAVSLSDGTAGELRDVVTRGKHNDEARDEIRDHLLAADRALITMTFLRDAGLDRFLKGVKSNLEAALEAELITDAEYEELWAGNQAAFAPLEERGVLKGDIVAYRLDGPTVRTLFETVHGEILVDVTRGEAYHGRGLKAAYFGPKGRFGNKLIKSLYERDR